MQQFFWQQQKQMITIVVRYSSVVWMTLPKSFKQEKNDLSFHIDKWTHVYRLCLSHDAMTEQQTKCL